jgi:hypothetical protein
MGPLADPVGLRTLGFRPRMLDLIQLEEQFVGMLIGRPAELRRPVQEVSFISMMVSRKL